MQKILIVDDEEIFIRITSKFLSEDYEVLTASSGSEAISICQKERPDLVLSDLMMPEVSGYDLLKNISSIYDDSIPFIFMTSDDREESEAKGFDAGALDYIKKPFKKDILLRRIASVMNQQSQMQALKIEAQTDMLTGLLNKTSSEEQITELCTGSNGALLIIDIDSFKLVNDLYGHDTGDKLLVAFSNILKKSVRAGDIVGRIGGDEFIAFCHHVHNEEIISEKSSFINNTLLAEAKTLMGDDMSIPIGASIGAVFVPYEGKEFAELYKKADTALFDVKQSGKHGYKIFNSGTITTNNEADTPEQMYAIRKILGERDILKGAMTVDLDDFRTIYRFLFRSTDNYHKRVVFMLVTIESDDSVEQLRDSFYEIFTNTLRKSDIVTKHGTASVLALLPETEDPIAQATVDRARSIWADKNANEYNKCKVSVIMENLNPRDEQ